MTANLIRRRPPVDDIDRQGWGPATDRGRNMCVGRGTWRLILSIDLELDLAHHEPSEQRRLDEVRRRLVDFTQLHRLPATWAVADPTLSAATESVLAARAGHEIAVLGEPAWLGRGCGRLRL